MSDLTLRDETHSCLFGKRECPAQLPGLADDTKGSEDNTCKKLLEPDEVQKPMFQEIGNSVTNCSENRFETMFSICRLGFVGMILLWGIRVPKVLRPEDETLGTLWESIPIPKSLDTKVMSRGQTNGASSPYIDEMMMTNVRQFQIQRFPNDKRFQTKLCEEGVGSGSNTMGYSERWLWGYG